MKDADGSKSDLIALVDALADHGYQTAFHHGKLTMNSCSPGELPDESDATITISDDGTRIVYRDSEDVVSAGTIEDLVEFINELMLVGWDDLDKSQFRVTFGE